MVMTMVISNPGKNLSTANQSPFQSELKLFVTSSNGVATCNLCGKMGNVTNTIARHVGLAHNKLKDVVGPDHSYYIKGLGWSNRKEDTTVTSTLTVNT